jgi:hypothetical protein
MNHGQDTCLSWPGEQLIGPSKGELRRDVLRTPASQHQLQNLCCAAPLPRYCLPVPFTRSRSGTTDQASREASRGGLSVDGGARAMPEGAAGQGPWHTSHSGPCRTLAEQDTRIIRRPPWPGFHYQITHHREPVKIRNRARSEPVDPGPGQPAVQTDHLWSIGFRHGETLVGEAINQDPHLLPRGSMLFYPPAPPSSPSTLCLHDTGSPPSP